MKIFLALLLLLVAKCSATSRFAVLPCDPKGCSFDEAKNICSSKSLRLASIKSAAENAEVLSILPRASRPTFLWIGAHTDATCSKGYRWMDNSCMEYTNFYGGQPTLRDSRLGDRCVEIFHLYSDDNVLSGIWNDVNCDFKLGTDVICESPLPIVSMQPQSLELPEVAIEPMIAKSETFPFLVSIVSQLGGHLCAASLIHPSYALTTKSCLKDWDIRTGFLSLPGRDAISPIESYYEKSKSNLALLKLKRPLATEQRNLLCIVSPRQKNRLQTWYVPGWGKEARPSNSSPRDIRYISGNVWTDKMCEQYSAARPHEDREGFDNELHYCFTNAVATAGEKTAPCDADKGGPLIGSFYDQSYGYRLGMFGVYEVHDSKEKPCAANMPSLFTRVNTKEVGEWLSRHLPAGTNVTCQFFPTRVVKFAIMQ